MAYKQPLLYVALGDSITTGVGSRGVRRGFVPRYHKYTVEAISQSVYPKIVAKHGLTTEELLSMINLAEVQESIQNAKIITISAGQNDLIQGCKQYEQDKNRQELKASLVKSKKNISAIIGEIKKLKKGKEEHPFIRLVDLYNPFKDNELADKWVTHYNLHLRDRAIYPIEVTDIYSSFKGREDELLSYDRLFPNQAGYQVIADELNKIGFHPLVDESKE